MKSNLKANIILSIIDTDTKEVYVYESWNPLEHNVEDYLKLRGHKNFKVTF